MALSCKIEEQLDRFTADVKDLCFSERVDQIRGLPDPLEFYREYVAKNKPVIIKDALEHWPALRKWSSDYLRSSMGECSVSVAMTPNGHADDTVQGKYFVTPVYRSMTINNFLDVLEGKKDKSPKGVYYIQKQNSNFVDEFQSLHGDVELELPWASKAFGSSPDAVNFWMGEEDAVTSMHKDHYENLYCVVSGEKHFILHPPTDIPYIPYGIYTNSHYKVNEESQLFEIECDPEGVDVPWISIDPLRPDLKQYPQYSKSNPVHCSIKSGEILYLPALWFHHVRQTHGTIAVNYWYDMNFDVKFCYFKLLENLTQPHLRTFYHHQYQ